ncbi:unnamed protein product [Aphanomyces euteiches]
MLISRETGKFMKCLKRSLSTLESGKNDRDALVGALNIYQHTHKKRKAFEFQQCYEVLSSCPKFCLSVDDAKCVSGESSLTPPDERNNGLEEMSDIAEKCGVKRAKRMKQEKCDRSQQLSIGVGIKKASEERNGLLRAYVMQTIFTATPVSEEHARFLELQKKMLLKDLEVQAKKIDPSARDSPSGTPEASQGTSFSSIVDGLSTTSQAKRATIMALCGENDDDTFEL